MTDAAANMFPWLPVRLVMSNRYNSIKRLQKFRGPLFQSHGASDEVVPIKLARKLFDSAPGDDKQFYEIAYARHNDTPSRPGSMTSSTRRSNRSVSARLSASCPSADPSQA